MQLLLLDAQLYFFQLWVQNEQKTGLKGDKQQVEWREHDPIERKEKHGF